MTFLKKLIIQLFKKLAIVFVSLYVIYIVGLATSSGINVLNIDTDNLDFNRILFVPGINTSARELIRWERDLAFNFPNKEIVFLDDTVYFYWQNNKTEMIVEKGIEILDDGESTLIIAHSYGGVLVKSIIERSKGANVVKLITMASPRTMNSFGIEKSKDFLETPDNVTVPTYSFGGYADPIVLFPKTKIKDSQHKDLWSGHNGFLFNKNVRKKVLEFALGLNYAE